MDVFGATYYITSPSQFWSELESVIYPDGRDVDNEWEDDGARKLSLDEIDEKVRTFVVFAGEWLGEYLDCRISFQRVKEAEEGMGFSCEIWVGRRRLFVAR